MLCGSGGGRGRRWRVRPRRGGVEISHGHSTAGACVSRGLVTVHGIQQQPLVALQTAGGANESAQRKLIWLAPRWNR